MLASAALSQVALVLHLVMSTWQYGPDWLRYLVIVVVSVSSATTPALWLAVVTQFFRISGDDVAVASLVTWLLLHGLLALPPLVLALVNCNRLLSVAGTRSLKRQHERLQSEPFPTSACN
jgi:hypothetical protein